jgi:hypothetical protein
LADDGTRSGLDGAPPEAGRWLREQYGRRGVLKMLVLAAVTAAVLASLFVRLDMAEVLGTLRRADPALLAWATLLALMAPLAGSLRWHMLLRACDERIPLATCARVLYAALPANVLTPSKAGDLLRSVLLRERVDVWKGMGIVLTERLVDVSVLSCLALAGSLGARRGAVVSPSSSSPPWGSGCPSAGASAGGWTSSSTARGRSCAGRGGCSRWPGPRRFCGPRT